MSNNSGGWIYSYEYQRYYCYTTNANGEQEVSWAPNEGDVQNEGQQEQAQSSQGVSQNYTNYEAATGARPRNDSAQSEMASPEMAPPAPDTVNQRLRFRGTPHLGWYDRLDPSYRIRERREAHEFFRIGRVFAMLWAESASATMTRCGTENTSVTVGRFGEGVFSQIRRFIVMQVNREKHFIYACAISTYGRQGTLKRGCTAAEHTAVYLRGTIPKRLEGEWEKGMTKDPIMIIPTDPQEFMEPTSRLRCGRIYSIEWNVKLKDIGMVAHHDRTKLKQYFEEEKDNGFDIDDDEYVSQPHQYHPGYGQ